MRLAAAPIETPPWGVSFTPYGENSRPRRKCQCSLTLPIFPGFAAGGGAGLGTAFGASLALDVPVGGPPVDPVVKAWASPNGTNLGSEP